MLNITRIGTAAIFGGAIAICAASAGHATPTVTTKSEIWLGNDSDPTTPGSYAVSQTDPQSSNSGGAVSSQYSASFSGLNSSGNSQTYSVDASAKASAEFGTLKAANTLHVTTPFANTAANSPYVNADYSVNPAGVPDYLGSDAFAIFKDTLALDAGASVTSLRLTFHLDGTITDNNLGQAMASTILIVNPTTSERYFISATPGAIDENVVVNLDVTDPNAIDLALELYVSSNAFLDIGGYSEDGSYILDADFYNTLELTGITGFDSDGHEVTLNGLTGDSGANYLALVGITPPSVDAPEPATLALFGAGLAGLRWRRRQKRS